MKLAASILTAACTAALLSPTVGHAQADTSRSRDTTRMRMQDSTRARGTMAQPPRQQTAQPPATSQQRLRVQKRQTGEAAGTLGDTLSASERMRRDSTDAAMQRQRDSVANIERLRADSVANVQRIERARADSVANVERMRQDSIAAVERQRADSVARVDSIARDAVLREQQRMQAYRFGGNGWYVGLGGGTSAPTSEFKSIGYNSGLNINVPIGWHRENRLLGVRLDLGYNQFSGRTFLGRNAGAPVTLTNSNPQVFSGALNLTAQIPVGFIRNVSIYGVGGGGIYHFRSFGGNSALGGFLGNDVLALNESNVKSTRNKYGAQLGAGVDWQVGASSIFLESRLESVFADRDDDVRFRDFFGNGRSSTLQWVPIVLGVKIR
ncbi:MAG TPA: hypothetical protein VE869_07140 [Gemmatimonas sp.]|nr:hypothetical protein [Gemmatimonas sp.]